MTHLTQAFFPFIPLLLIMFGGLAAAIAMRKIISNIQENLRSKKHFVALGMPRSGKTTLQYKLRNMKGVIAATNMDGNGLKKTTIRFQTKDGREKIVTLLVSDDIGGQEFLVAKYYKKYIRESDICVFVFNIREYLENNEYRKETNGRLQHLSDELKNSNKTEEAVYYIGSHLDQMKNKNEIYDKVIDMSKKQIEGNLISPERLLLVNLTSDNDIKIITQTLFS